MKVQHTIQRTLEFYGEEPYVFFSVCDDNTNNVRYQKLLCQEKMLTPMFIVGGFYQNTVGHHGTLAGRTGCLPCPKGTYVELDKFPAKNQFACRVCPAGKSFLFSHVTFFPWHYVQDEHLLYIRVEFASNSGLEFQRLRFMTVWNGIKTVTVECWGICK